VITRGVGEILPNAQVPLRRHHGRVAQTQLNLLESGFAPMRQSGKCSSKVMRSEAGYANRPTGTADDLKNAPSGEAVTCDPLTLIELAKDKSALDSGHPGPCVDGLLSPLGHGHAAHSSAFADQIDNHPSAITLLNVPNGEVHGFTATQATTDEHGQQRTIARSFQRGRVRNGNKTFGLFACPVRTPACLGPFTRKIAEAWSGEMNPLSAASIASLRMAESLWLIVEEDNRRCSRAVL
jgi:hypothetical protein